VTSDEPQPAPDAAEPPARRGGAASVASGILLSRILGILRESTLAHYFGVGPHADAFTAALRAPNALQNLLGEGSLSAAFIPIYSRLLADGREEEAGRFAGAVFGLLLATASTIALLGVLLARPLVFALAPGFYRDAARVAAGELAVDRFELCVHAVRILFPMTGLLVLAVWALAILNSHRRFFLPYFAPALWNAAIITSLVLTGSVLERGGLTAARLPLDALTRLLYAACWGGFAGGLLQFLVQVPLVVRLIRGFELSFSTRVAGVREALAALGPVIAGRGVVQIAGYVDLFLATQLATGAASADRFAQMPYLLPISLFGLSMAASELPELSRLRGEGAAPQMLARVRRVLGAMAFLNIPTVVGYLAFGYLIIGALYRSGSFTVSDTWLVYLVLCGYSLGILATTSSRLLQNTFYALGETRVPARIAVQRVSMSIAVALPLMFWLDRYPLSALVGPLAGQPLRLGAVGLSTASAAGAWLELTRLRRALRRRLPGFDLPWKQDGKMAACALPVRLEAPLVLAVYGIGYFAAARLAGLEEASAFLAGLRRRLRR
jgi:putative peptidoglycan lipid II flippase